MLNDLDPDALYNYVLFITIQYENKSSELLLMLDYGIFYEFIPIKGDKEDDSDIIPLSEVALNTNYSIVITTNGFTNGYGYNEWLWL